MAHIVSCVGHEQAGKDTACRWITALASPHIEVLRYAHADELKNIASKILNIPREDFDVKMKTPEGGYLRDTLVRTSVALKEAFGPAVFAQRFIQFVQEHPHALIIKTDDRFSEEFNYNPEGTVYLGVTHPVQKGDPSKPYYETVCHALAQITSGTLTGQIFHNSELSLTPTPNFQNIFAELVRPFGLPFSNSAFSSPKKSKIFPSTSF